MMDNTESFGRWIHQRRRVLDLTQDELARQVCCSIGTIRKIEADERRPSKELATRLAACLEVSSVDHLAFITWARTDSTPPVHRVDTAPAPLVQPPPPALAMRHQLRPPIADFVGRAHELESLVAKLRAAPGQEGHAAICGVLGMGGIGKTELTYKVAHQVLNIFPDAQIVLDLRGSHATPLSSEQALQQVIQAFMPDAQLPDNLLSLERLYRSLLHNQRVLILADDAYSAAQVRPLIPPAGSALLITGRTRFTLPGMITIHLEHLTAAEAVTLLLTICDRLNLADAQTIVQTCSSLPLALRITASILRNTPALSVSAYLARLSDERQRLGHLRDPDDPQLDVAASLALSYSQLDPAIQLAFRQLGVFVADFTTELARAVIAELPGVDVEATLHHLLRRNQVMYDEEQERWRLHDLMRDLARYHLEHSGMAQAAHWRYAWAAVQAVQAIQAQYQVGRVDILKGLAQFGAERPHIEAARRWAADHAGTPEGDMLLLAEAQATMVIGPLRYDQPHERIPQLERAYAAAHRLNDRSGAGQMLNSLGNAYRMLGQIRQASAYYESALAIFRALGDEINQGRTLANLGLAYTELGAARLAIEYYTQALAIFRALGYRTNEGVTLINLGRAYTQIGKAERGIAYYEGALAIFHVLNNRYYEGIVLSNLGLAHSVCGNHQLARTLCARALASARDVGDRRQEGDALSILAGAEVACGNLAGATALFVQACGIFREIGDPWGEADCYWYYGVFLAQQGERDHALPPLQGIDAPMSIGIQHRSFT